MENKDRKSFGEISTAELRQQLKNPELKLIDIRSPDAYNGWALSGEPRGGHIRGAKSLAYKWSGYIDWIEIIRSKNVLPKDSLIIYGYQKDKIDEVAHKFRQAGYPNIGVYYRFCQQWSANPNLPLDKLAKHRHLVPAQWLKRLIDTGSAPEYQNKKFIICHCHYRNPGDYNQGHIPGALEVDTNSLESPKTWNRRRAEEIKKTLENLGITADTTVVLYGRFSYPNKNDPFPGSSAGHLGAIRSALIMHYAGVKDIRILNGGLQSWQDQEYEITKKETKSSPVDDFEEKIPANPQIIVDIEEAKEILRSENKNLVSVRSWAEFIGQASGYNYIEKKGRIPGAIFGNCGSDAYHMENYRNLDHTLREYHEIENAWQEVGITPDKYTAFYCGTGWRASEAFFAAWLMGWPKVVVFDGGWFQWSNDAGNPYQTGIPEKAFQYVNRL